MCFICHKEYDEENNFKWSCRIHTHPWSDQVGLYWCCGKRKKTARGCKPQYHVSYKSDDEDDNNEEAKEIIFKCHLCNGHDHKADNCI